MASIIGEKFTVKVTRPIGSTYPSNEDIKYNINYGEIVDVLDAYGEPQEAYMSQRKTHPVLLPLVDLEC